MHVRHTIRRLPAALSLAAAAAGLTAVASPADAHAAPARRGPSVLHAGQTLAPGRALAARRGPSRLLMRRDGNLVLQYLPVWQRTPVARAARPVAPRCRTRRCRFLRPRTLWRSGTAGHPGARLRVTHEGRIVVVRRGRVLWHARTGGRRVAALKLRDRGNLVARPAGGAARSAAAQTLYAWQTGTSTPQSAGSTLDPGETLGSNEYLVSPNGQYELDMQPNGLAIVWAMGDGPCPMYVLPTLTAATNTIGSYNNWRYEWTAQPVPGSQLTMQSGGNLVLTAPGGSVLWQLGQQVAGTSLTMQDDGNLVAYGASGNPLWSTQTDVQRGAELCPGATLQNDQVLRSWNWPNASSWEQLQFAQDDGEGAELDVVGMSSDGSAGGVSHVFRSKSAISDPYLVMQEDGNLVVYPPGAVANGDTAEWATGTNGNPGAWATLRLSGSVLQVLSAPVVSPGDSRMLLPQTAILYENEKPDHGGNNAALLGPTAVPLD
jgi:hypothetical protein